MAERNVHESSSQVTWPRLLVFTFLGLVVLVLGVAGGIRLGLSSGRVGQITAVSFRNSSLLDVGETFPDYVVRPLLGGESQKLSAITRRSPALLIFASDQCSACEAQFKFWKKRVVPMLNRDIGIVVVFSEGDYTPSDAQQLLALMPRASAVVTARERQSEIDGILATPTTIGVDQGLTIKFVVTGHDPRATADFFNDQLTP